MTHPTIVEVQVKVTKTFSAQMEVRSTDMDDMTQSELIATYWNEDEIELGERDVKIEIEDYQYTTSPY